MRIGRSTLVGTAVAIALFARNDPTMAQQNTNSASTDGGLEEVVVTGIRASLRSSIDTKRSATTIVDAITAEDVGKFPDKNLAEALQRVPGIVVNREFGEGERVSLRGTAPNLTRTLLNGHSLATADWFILDQQNSTRSFNFLMLPSDIIGKVNVYKSPQADFEEGGVGGTIDVATRNPLDLDAFTAFGSLQAAYSDLSEKTNPQASALLSWKNASETIGILGAAVYQEREIRRDGVEVLGYETDPASGTLAPSLIGSALFTQERVRKGGNIGVQFKPNEQFDSNLTALYSKFDADNINQNFMAWGSRVMANGAFTPTRIVDGTAVAGRFVSGTRDNPATPENEGLANGTTDFGVVYDAIVRNADAETRNIDFDANYKPADGWNVHFKVGYTDAEGNTNSQPFVEFGAPASLTYDLSGRAPQVTYENFDATDPADMNLIFASLHQILNTDEETYAYADVLKDVQWGPVSSIKAGAKFSDHDRETKFNATTYGSFAAPLVNTGCNGGPCTGSSFAGGLTPGNYLNGIDSPGTLDSYWQINPDVVTERLFDQFGQTTGRVPYPQQQFAVNEKSYAGYVMGNFAGEGWRGNAGVRVVRTEQTSEGAQIRPDGSVSNPFGSYDPLDVERTYTDVLPSFNIAYDLRDDIVVRFAVARVMARPDFTDIAPRASLNLGSLTGTSGNPNIDPYRANQADLSFEFYPDSSSVFAVGLYYKDIKSFVTDAPVLTTLPIITGTPSANCTPTGTTDLFNCPFTINQRVNGEGGRIQGFELSATRPIWGGFGIQANYTFTDAQADNGDPLQGTSEDQFNTSLYFENQLISTRVSYTYRSDFFVTFDRATQLNQKALESVDASLNVNLTEQVALTFDGVNLTNEKIVQYASDTFRPRAIYNNGRIFFAGARFKF